MITITINGKPVKANDGEMVLAVLRREKIEVPALCHHEAVEPYGACRLCMVEVSKPGWTSYDMVTSCLFPVSAGLVVLTHSPAILEFRKTMLDLFLARNPHTPLIQDLASRHGLDKTSYQVVPDPNDCILCGICTRVCDTMGFKAISMANRGHGREVAPPLHEAPEACVGCLSCAHSCPTGYIKFSDNGRTRVIWEKQFELIRDQRTGQPTITREFAAYLVKHRDIPESYFDMDDSSHRQETANTLGKITHLVKEAVS